MPWDEDSPFDVVTWMRNCFVMESLIKRAGETLQ